MISNLKNSKIWQFREPIQQTLSDPLGLPSARLGKALLLQVHPQVHLLQAPLLQLQARQLITMAWSLDLQDQPCSHALNVRTVLPFGFSLNSRK